MMSPVAAQKPQARALPLPLPVCLMATKWGSRFLLKDKKVQDPVKKGAEGYVCVIT